MTHESHGETRTSSWLNAHEPRSNGSFVGEHAVKEAVSETSKRLISGRAAAHEHTPPTDSTLTLKRTFNPPEKEVYSRGKTLDLVLEHS